MDAARVGSIAKPLAGERPAPLDRRRGVPVRRAGVLALSAAALLGIMLGGGGRFAAAQDPGGSDHPAVGAWLVDSDPGDAEYSPRQVVLAADGTALLVSGQQTTGVGAWEPAGDSAAVLTVTLVTDGPAYIVLRATLDVAAGGRSFAGSFTIEAVFDPADGETSGEIGPGTLEGTRLEAEAPGTPVDSFEGFFRLPEGTPVA